MARSCNNCVALGKECMVEPDDRERSAENCPCYESYDDYFRRGQWEDE